MAEDPTPSYYGSPWYWNFQLQNSAPLAKWIWRMEISLWTWKFLPTIFAISLQGLFWFFHFLALDGSLVKDSPYLLFTTVCHIAVSSLPNLHSHLTRRARFFALRLSIPSPPNFLGVVNLAQFTQWLPFFILAPFQRKFLNKASIFLQTSTGALKMEKKYADMLERTALINVTLPPLEIGKFQIHDLHLYANLPQGYHSHYSSTVLLFWWLGYILGQAYSVLRILVTYRWDIE